MSQTTGIEWTEATWNPLRGCSRVSEGCEHCYAEMMAARFSGPGQPFAGFAKRVHGKPHWTGKVELVESKLLEPLHWKKPRRIFVNSMSDLFHESVQPSDLVRIFAVMALTPHHTYQILTKRAENAARLVKAIGETAYYGSWGFLDAILEEVPLHTKFTIPKWPLPNVWLGVSVENQERANERIPHLLATPAAMRWVSYEPALGGVDYTRIETGHRRSQAEPDTLNALTGRERCGHGEFAGVFEYRNGPSLDWIVAGGESGPGARPAHPDWFRSVRDQCAGAGVPFLFKQWGAWTQHDPRDGGDLSGDDGRIQIVHPTGQTDVEVFRETGGSTVSGSRYMARVGKKWAGRRLDEVLHDEYPAKA